jgi:hypothetical protein
VAEKLVGRDPASKSAPRRDVRSSPAASRSREGWEEIRIGRPCVCRQHKPRRFLAEKPIIAACVKNAVNVAADHDV